MATPIDPAAIDGILSRAAQRTTDARATKPAGGLDAVRAKQGISDDDVDGILSRAAMSVKDSQAGRLKSAGGRFVRGAASVLASVPESIAEFPILKRESVGVISPAEAAQQRKDSTLNKAGQFIRDVTRTPINPAYQEEFTQKLAEGFGSAGGFLAGGMAGAAAKIPALLSTGALGFAATAVEGARDAERSGADAKAKYEAFLLNGGLGLTEAVPISRVLNRLDKGSGGQVSRILKEGLKGTLEEGIQEFVQGAGQNAIAQALYDADRAILDQGVKEGTEIGGIIGFTLSALATALGGRRGMRPKGPNERAAEAASGIIGPDGVPAGIVPTASGLGAPPDAAPAATPENVPEGALQAVGTILEPDPDTGEDGEDAIQAAAAENAKIEPPVEAPIQQRLQAVDDAIASATDDTVKFALQAQREVLAAEAEGRKEKLTRPQKEVLARTVDQDADDLLTVIRKKGGLNVAGEDSAADFAGMFKGNKAAQGSLNIRGISLNGVEQKGSGLSLDGLSEYLFENGWIPANDSKLAYDLLDRAAKGEQVFSPKRSNEAIAQQMEAEEQGRLDDEASQERDAEATVTELVDALGPEGKDIVEGAGETTNVALADKLVELRDKQLVDKAESDFNDPDTTDEYVAQEKAAIDEKFGPDAAEIYEAQYKSRVAAAAREQEDAETKQTGAKPESTGEGAGPAARPGEAGPDITTAVAGEQPEAGADADAATEPAADTAESATADQAGEPGQEVTEEPATAAELKEIRDEIVKDFETLSDKEKSDPDNSVRRALADVNKKLDAAEAAEATEGKDVADMSADEFDQMLDEAEAEAGLPEPVAKPETTGPSGGDTGVAPETTAPDGETGDKPAPGTEDLADPQARAGELTAQIAELEAALATQTDPKKRKLVELTLNGAKAQLARVNEQISRDTKVDKPEVTKPETTGPTGGETAAEPDVEAPETTGPTGGETTPESESQPEAESEPDAEPEPATEPEAESQPEAEQPETTGPTGGKAGKTKKKPAKKKAKKPKAAKDAPIEGLKFGDIGRNPERTLLRSIDRGALSDLAQNMYGDYRVPKDVRPRYTAAQQALNKVLTAMRKGDTEVDVRALFKEASDELLKPIPEDATDEQKQAISDLRIAVDDVINVAQAEAAETERAFAAQQREAQSILNSMSRGVIGSQMGLESLEVQEHEFPGVVKNMFQTALGRLQADLSADDNLIAYVEDSVVAVIDNADFIQAVRMAIMREKARKASGKRSGGKKGSTGVSLRRWYELYRNAVKAADGDYASFIKAIGTATNRAKLFNINDLTGEKGTPGKLKLLAEVRDELDSFGDFLARDKAFRSYGYGSWQEVIANTNKAELLAVKKLVRAAARRYIDEIAQLGEVVSKAENITTTMQAIESFAVENHATKSGKARVPYSINWLQLRYGWTAQKDKQSTKNAIRDEYDESETKKKILRRSDSRKPVEEMEFANNEDALGKKKPTPQALKETFGLPDITVGGWVGGAKEEFHVTAASRAFSDLMKLLGLTNKSFSHNGLMHFAFGALGQGRHAAHFSPNTPHPSGGRVAVINVTRDNGDGTVAHEWGHSLDYLNLNENGAQPGASRNKGIQVLLSVLKRELDHDQILLRVLQSVDRTLLRGLSKNKDGKWEAPSYYVEQAKQEITNTQHNMDIMQFGSWQAFPASDYFMQAQSHPNAKYWGNDRELFARAFEAWVYDTMQKGDTRNEYLVSDWVADGKTVGYTKNGTFIPYARAEERQNMNKAFDVLVKHMSSDENNRVVIDEAAVLKDIRSLYQETIDGLNEVLNDLPARVEELVAERQEAADAEAERIAAEQQAEKEAQQAALDDLRGVGKDIEDMTPDEFDDMLDDAEQAASEEDQEPERPEQTTNPADDAAAELQENPVFTGISKLANFVADTLLPSGLYEQEVGTENPIDIKEFFKKADEVFGGTRAKGAYTDVDAFEALDIGVARYVASLIDNGTILIENPSSIKTLQRIERDLPVAPEKVRAALDQRRRGSTPPSIAFAMTQLAGITESDVVLDPSAGTGTLGTLALTQTQNVHVNDLGLRNLATLAQQGYASVSSENAADAESALTEIKPSVILMNPPVENTVEQSAAHVEAAYAALRPGGRLVVVLGPQMARSKPKAHKFWSKFNRQKAQIPLVAQLPGTAKAGTLLGVDVKFTNYVKNGEPSDSVIAVIDKPPLGEVYYYGNATSGTFSTVENLLDSASRKQIRIEEGDSRERYLGVRNARFQSGKPTVNQPIGGESIEGSEDRPASGPVGGSGTGTGSTGGNEVVQPGGTATGNAGTDGGSQPGNPDANAGSGAGNNIGDTATDESSEGVAGEGQPDTGSAAQPDGRTGGKLPVSDEIDDWSDLDDLLGDNSDANDAVNENPALYSLAEVKLPEGLNAEFYEKLRPRLDQKLKQYKERELKSQSESDPSKRLKRGSAVKMLAVDVIKKYGRDKIPYLRHWKAELDAERKAADAKRAEQEGIEPATTSKAPLVDPEQDPDAALAQAARDSESLFGLYKPTLTVEGSQPHPGKLDESQAMADVLPPQTDFVPDLPPEMIASGAVSDAQLEPVIMAGHAHSQMLPMEPDQITEYRKGFLVGDGTGFGKTRELIAMMVDSWRQGRKKAIYISMKDDLLRQFNSDMDEMGIGDLMPAELQSVMDIGDTISTREGIVFGTYSGLGTSQGEKIKANNSEYVVGREVTVGRAQEGLPEGTVGKIARSAKANAKAAQVRFPGQTKPISVPTRFLNLTGEKPEVEVRTKVDQLVEWVGEDFDGMLVFDEAHIMKNATNEGGPPSDTATAGMELARRLPKARVVYVSATAAADVHNMAYLERLGLWGRGTEFPTVNAFISEIEAGGVQAMELIAQNMKARGVYMARTISMGDVERGSVSHDLTPQDTAQYQAAVDAFHTVRKALTAAGQLSGHNEEEKWKGKINSQTWGFQLRFFGRIMIGMQTPSMIADMQKRFDAGEVAVVQLVNTNEANQTKALDKLENKDALDDIGLSAEEAMVDAIMALYPVTQLQPGRNAKGKRVMVEVLDEVSKPIEVKEYVEARDRLIEQVRGSMSLPEGPLDQLLNHTFMIDGKPRLGADIGAEVTGRKTRLRRDANGNTIIEAKPSNESEINAFMDGRKWFLMFSAAGGTGADYHADLKRINQRKRNHYGLQMGYDVLGVLQGLGRSHRSNQKQAPRIITVETNLKSQKRFTSAISAKLDQVGALTGGSRDTGRKGVFTAEDNLQTTYAREALNGVITDILKGNLAPDGEAVTQLRKLQDNINAAFDELSKIKAQSRDLLTAAGERADNLRSNIKAWKLEQSVINADYFTRQQLEDELGLDLDKLESGYDPLTGYQAKNFPPVGQFLNRLMATAPARQDKYFELFEERLVESVEIAKAEGTFDAGIESIRGQSVEAVHREQVYKDPNSGSVAEYVQLEVTDPVEYNSIRDVIDRVYGTTGKFIKFIQQKRSKRVYAIFAANDRVDKAGGRTPMYRRVGIRADHEPLFPQADIQTKGYRGAYLELTPAEAGVLWEAETTAAPETQTRKYNMITGDVLSVWKKIVSKPLVYRTVTDSMDRIIGRIVKQQDLVETLNNLNAGGAKIDKSPANVFKKLKQNWEFRLANRWVIKTVVVNEQRRIEIKGPSMGEDRAEIGSWVDNGAAAEVIESETRFFLPTEPVQAHAVLKTILEYRDIAAEVAPAGSIAEKSKEYQPGRDNATPEQRQMGNELLNESAANAKKDETRGIKTVASAINAELINTQVVSLVGKTITNTEELADLAQVYRDPRYETLRYFFTDAKGKVLGQVGVSSRLPGSSAAFPMGSSGPFWVGEQAKKFGAAKVWMVHNHPSGNAVASGSDVRITDAVNVALKADGIDLEHVIVNSNEYGIVGSSKETSQVVKRDWGEDKLLTPSKPHKALGYLIDSPQAAARVGKMISQGEGWVTIVATSARGNVRALGEIHETELYNAEGRGKVAKRMQEWGVSVGAGRLFIVGADSTVIDASKRTGQSAASARWARSLMKRGVLKDIVDTTGKSMMTETRGFIEPEASPENLGLDQADRTTVTEEQAPVYRIIDNQTGQQVGADYKNRRRAYTRADKLDLEYGAIRYRVETPAMRQAKADRVGEEKSEYKSEITTAQEAAVTNLSKSSGGQVVDRLIRLPFKAMGLVNDRGEWRWGAEVASPAAKRILTESKFKDTGKMAFLNPYLLKVRNGMVDRFGLDQEFIDREAEIIADRRLLESKGVEFIQQIGQHVENEAEWVAIHKMLTGQDVAGNESVITDAEWNGLAEEVRSTIDELGLEAVQMGLISRDSYERNKGSYLHRVYEIHENSQGNIAKAIGKMMGGRRHQIKGDELKGRGIFLTVAQNRLLRHFPDKLLSVKKGPKADPTLLTRRVIILDDLRTKGEGVEKLPDMPDGSPPTRLKERVYWPADVAIPRRYSDYKNQGNYEIRGTKGNQLTLWRDYTLEERTAMGEIMDARYTIAKTFHVLARDLSSAKFFNDIAANSKWTWPEDSTPPEATIAPPNAASRSVVGYEWALVPNTTISKTGGVKKWGNLAGRYVQAEIWRDINELDKMQNPGTWNSILKQWKLNKTARNPVVHTNNVISNLILMDLIDVNARDLFRGLKSYRAQDENYQQALHNGAFGHSFADTDLVSEVLDPMLKKMESEARKDVWDGFSGKLRFADQFARLLSEAGNRISDWDEKGVDIYRMEDEVFRMATFISLKGRGYSDHEAAALAREQFLNYDIRAPWVNAARRSVLPFLSYSYRAIPAIADAIARRPWKMAKYMVLAEMANALAYAVTGGDEDEERRSLRPQERGSVWMPGVPRMMRTPFNDGDEAIFLDIRRWVPAGDVFDMNMGSSSVPIPAWLQFGGPIMIAGEIFTNKQAFSGQEITNRTTDTVWEQFKGTGGFIYRSWMPSNPVVPGSWYQEKLWRAGTGGRDSQGRDYSVPQALASSLGFKVSPQDPSVNFRYRAQEFNRTERALKFEIRQTARDRDRNLISNAEYQRSMRDTTAKLEKLAEERASVFTSKEVSKQ